VSLADILINPPDPIFYTATILAFILSIVLSLYVCEELNECSEGMKFYYYFIFMILGFSLFIAMAMHEKLSPNEPSFSYILIIPVLFFIVHIIIAIIHVIYVFYKYKWVFYKYKWESKESIEAVLMLGGFLVFLVVCVIIMGSYILNLPVAQAGNLPVTEYYTTTKTVASLVITVTSTTTRTVTQSPITYTVTNMVTKTEVVTSTVPESTLTITLRPLLSEYLVALAIAVAMMIASIPIGLKLRKK